MRQHRNKYARDNAVRVHGIDAEAIEGDHLIDTAHNSVSEVVGGRLPEAQAMADFMAHEVALAPFGVFKPSLRLYSDNAVAFSVGVGVRHGSGCFSKSRNNHGRVLAEVIGWGTPPEKRREYVEHQHGATLALEVSHS